MENFHAVARKEEQNSFLTTYFSSNNSKRTVLELEIAYYSTI